jgi:hypothetical protein
MKSSIRNRLALTVIGLSFLFFGLVVGSLSYLAQDSLVKIAQQNLREKALNIQ